MTTPQFASFLPEYADRRPEVKITLYITDRLNANGGEPIDISIVEIQRGTGLCYRTVQKYRLWLIKAGVFRLLSSGRERSVYALPAPSAGEEILRRLTKMADFHVDANFIGEAEALAGGQSELLVYLRALGDRCARKYSRASFKTLIRRASYNFGFIRHRT